MRSLSRRSPGPVAAFAGLLVLAGFAWSRRTGEAAPPAEDAPDVVGPEVAAPTPASDPAASGRSSAGGRAYPATPGLAPATVQWNGEAVPVPDLAGATLVQRDPLSGTVLASSGVYAAVDGRMLVEVGRALGGEVPADVMELLKRAQQGAREEELREAMAAFPQLSVRVAIGRWIAARFAVPSKPASTQSAPPPPARL